MADMIVGVDWAGPGGDVTAVSAICPVCKTLYAETLEEGATVVAVRPCPCAQFIKAGDQA